MTLASIAIIGAGFSGTSLALCLQAMCPRGTNIRLIERARRFAVGVAYGTSNPNHLLNVPAGRMSMFPDLPGDFVDWLRQQPAALLGDVVADGATFVPRGLYGRYLWHALQRGLDNSQTAPLELVQDEVIDARESADTVRLSMSSGNVMSADIAVLATGNPAALPVHPDIAKLITARCWCGDPWAPTAFAALDAAAPVVLIGSGLTAVDAVISLLDAGHTGPIHALSRHGLLPRAHVASPAAPVILPTPVPEGIAALTRYIRREISCAADWRPVIDALRPVTQDLWRRLSLSDRRRFACHLRAWWDVHRHRMPPQCADRIRAALASNQLRVHAGRIVGIDVTHDRAKVSFRARSTGDVHTLPAALVVDCTGPGMDLTRCAAPLIRALLQAGIARPDPLRLGLDVTTDGAVVNGVGVASRRLFAVGPLTKGAFWEITAVPDLRVRCRELAGLLGNRLAGAAT